MRLLLDENLSHRLTHALRDLFPRDRYIVVRRFADDAEATFLMLAPD